VVLRWLWVVLDVLGGSGYAPERRPSGFKKGAKMALICHTVTPNRPHEL